MRNGIFIEFKDFSPQVNVPHQYKFNEIEHLAIKNEIQSLLNKRVIKIVNHCNGEFISNVFVRPKRDGKFRMILNLCGLNEAVVYHKFKMSTLQSAINLMFKGCFMATLDWKDAYYCVPIHKVHRKLLRFQFDDVLYEFQALPNGLASGPRLFTKLTKPFFSHLRKKGLLNSPYIDDCLLVGDSWEDCKNNIIETMELSEDTGFIVHPEKSLLEPSQIIEYLGFILNSINMTVSVNARQADKIKNACITLASQETCTILQLAKVVGLLVASIPGVKLGKLFYRRLDNIKTKELKNKAGNFKAKMNVSADMIEDLNWWINNIHSSYRELEISQPDMYISSDSSKTGWGGAFGDQATGGNWSSNEADMHINYLELKAAWFVIRTFLKDKNNIHVRLNVDNTTALAYLNNMGGKIASYNNLARKIWLWCLDRNIWLSAAYIPSAQNVEADSQSRMDHDNIEWELNDEIFKEICTIFGCPDVDLFASRLNHKVQNYISWKPDPFAIAVDAFTLNWNSFKPYIFAPFSLIAKILQKLEMDQVQEAIMIIPLWTTQPWFSKLLRMLTCCPLVISRKSDSLLHPVRKQHPLSKMQLAVCKLSTDNLKTKDFQTRLQKSSCPLGDIVQRNNTHPILGDGLNFAIKTTTIHCHRL